MKLIRKLKVWWYGKCHYSGHKWKTFTDPEYDIKERKCIRCGTPKE